MSAWKETKRRRRVKAREAETTRKRAAAPTTPYEVMQARWDAERRDREEADRKRREREYEARLNGPTQPTSPEPARIVPPLPKRPLSIRNRFAFTSLLAVAALSTPERP